MEVLSAEALHFLGIKVVYKHLVDNGYEVLNVRREPDVNPQVLAQKGDQKWLVVVKTAVYPHMGVLYPEVADEVLRLAQKRGTGCLFASVGIANANGETEEEMAQPVQGGEYYINFKGLQPFPSY
jgi:hypothetical protein